MLLKEEDFFDMALAYFERAAADNVVHAEIFFDPQTHTDARRADRDRDRRPGSTPAGARMPSSASARTLILCFLRHLSEEAALRHAGAGAAVPRTTSSASASTAASAATRRRSSRACSRRCRELGLHVVAHAGEEGPPAYIESALDVLQGRSASTTACAASRDPALVQRLARERMPLTVCPLSNVKLCVFNDAWPSTTCRRCSTPGLCATVNSDDPAYFGGYINDNFVADLRRAAARSARARPTQLARNSFEASFVDEPHKARWRAALDATFSEAARGSS